MTLLLLYLLIIFRDVVLLCWFDCSQYLSNGFGYNKLEAIVCFCFGFDSDSDFNSDFYFYCLSLCFVSYFNQESGDFVAKMTTIREFINFVVRFNLWNCQLFHLIGLIIGAIVSWLVYFMNYFQWFHR